MNPGLPEPLLVWAKQASGSPVVAASRLSGGRNSQVWRVETANGAVLALKRYHAASGGLDRLTAEWNALAFLRDQGVANTPRPLWRNVELGAALHTFFDGLSPAPFGPEPEAVDPLIDFALTLYSLRRTAAWAGLPPAVGAKFDLSGIETELRRRNARLTESREGGEPGRQLEAFLRDAWRPAVVRALEVARVGLGDEDRPPPPDRLLPSPSDFGFHNAVRRPDGGLGFVDFEYFGLDDPAKLLADLLLHPGMNLSPAQGERLLERLLPALGGGWLWRRLNALLPLWRLVWCAILLNEFLSGKIARRAFAAGTALNREALLLEQLSKAQRMLENNVHVLLARRQSSNA